VQERTAELAATLAQLQAEMAQRQLLSEELRQVQKMEAVGRLAGGVAHDFNNILAAIIGYTELATHNTAASSPAWRQLQEVLRACQRAKALVQQILTFSRRTEQVYTSVQLPSLVEETLALLRASLPSTIEIRQHIDNGVGAVLADPTQLHQVIINLCANAEYAMRQTGGLLEIRLESVEVEATLAAQYPTLHLGPYARLTVRDTGQGMPPDIVERMYDPFFTTKAAGEGTGIGLSVVHGIVASHGGTITVESQVGCGTTFMIYLPCIPWDLIGEMQAEESLPHGQGRLLLVDDEPALVRLGYSVLTQLGYDVTTYTSSVEALAAFQATPDHFDLVITDYTMPQMTGEALARALRSLRPDIPIILETGFSHTIDAERAAALGLNAFLLKPWTVRELARTIAQVLAHGRT
jgi:nitrogen-specific signal transduction histidine kinase/ActR/RegA family two-component response regulator